MNRHALLLICICVLSLIGCDQKPASNNAPPQPKKMSDIALDPAIFGEDWEVSAGIALDSWDDMSSLPGAAQAPLRPIRTQMEPLGLIALADVSCVRKGFPLNTVTVRVFKFKNAELASAWGKKKYQYAGWEQHYTPVEGVSYFAVDSTQIKKRCVIRDEYWITSHHISDSDIHVKALEAIMKQLGRRSEQQAQ